MMETLTLRIALLLATLAGALLQLAAGESTGTGVGGNVAGSTITIPTATPVPYNQSCAVGTHFLNGTNLGIYCNTDDYSDWDYDWTSYVPPIAKLRR